MLEVGEKVWWEDPDESTCSGVFEIQDVPEEADGSYYCTDGLAGHVEALRSELTLLNDDETCAYCGEKCYQGEGCDEFNAGEREFVVTVTRTEIRRTDIRVKAGCVGDAKHIALDEAGGIEFSSNTCSDPEYNVEGISEG